MTQLRHQLAGRFVTDTAEPDEIGNLSSRATFAFSDGATSRSASSPTAGQLSEYHPDDSPRYTFRTDGTGSADYAPSRYEFQTLSGERVTFGGHSHRAADAATDDRPARRSGAHRLPAPPAALKGRAAVVAVAAGAVVAAGQAALNNAATDSPVGAATEAQANAAIAAMPQAAQFLGETQTIADTTSTSQAPQVLTVASPVDTTQFQTMLTKGEHFAEEKAAREAAARRPMFVLPAVGAFTSGFGSRWGTLHAGVDIANAIGTPILAVADGEVIEAGPASGFGMWVRLKHDDGTVTIYGHIDSATVQAGQRVMAGDEIAKMGNRGFSTGPHVHFEVWLNGSDKTDPLPWLASRGISLGPSRD